MRIKAQKRNGKVLVIGGGINGLCLAEAFLSKNFDVEVFDSAHIPNPNAPSYLEAQVVRPQYVQHMGLAVRIEQAIHAWREIFSKLGENFYRPTGVLAISRHEGDWSDHAFEVMRDNHLPFRYVQPHMLKDLLPGFRIDNVRMGIMADQGGYLHGRALVERLYAYLLEKGVKFHAQEAVQKVDVEKGQIQTINGSYSGDWVIATTAHHRLLPEFNLYIEDFAGCFVDIVPPENLKNFWRFVPVWVDLGGEDNCWGIPRAKDGLLRLGAGLLSDQVHKGDEEMKEALFGVYDDILVDFSQYEIRKFHRVAYQGYQDASLVMKRVDRAIALVGDSGHGFKFAAENARLLANAVEDEQFTMAARQIAGVV